MKYVIGSIVVLKNGNTVYITSYNEKTKEYSGFDAADAEAKEEIAFFETDVMLTV